MRSYLYPIIFAIAAISLLIADYTPRPTQQNLYTTPTNIFHVKDQKFYGNDGQPVWITGMNLGQWLVLEGYLWGLGPHRLQRFEYNYAEHEIRAGLDWVLEKTNIDTHKFLMSYRDSFITRDDIAYIKSLGFNLIRIPFSTKDFDAYFQDEEVRDTDFTYLDRAVAWCKEFEIYCLLDLHAAPKSQNTLPHSDSTGTADFWDDVSVQQKTTSFWGVLAERYYNQPWIAGFDLLNEPQAPNDKVLNDWYAKTIETIRKTGNQHVLFVQPNNITLDIESVLQADTGIVYAPHYYGFGRKAEEENTPMFEMKERLQVPVMIGEVGNWANDWWAKYSDHFILYRYLAQQVPIVYWNYKDMIYDNQSSFGIVHGKTDGAFDQFARAIESETQLPPDFDTDELLSSFSTIDSPDRSDVVDLLQRAMPPAIVDAYTSEQDVEEMLKKDPPRRGREDRHVLSFLEWWKPYMRCDGIPVRECFDLP